jgi:hypothetical protein
MTVFIRNAAYEVLLQITNSENSVTIENNKKTIETLPPFLPWKNALFFKCSDIEWILLPEYPYTVTINALLFSDQTLDF